jgi:hypothetical protein
MIMFLDTIMIIDRTIMIIDRTIIIIIRIIKIKNIKIIIAIAIIAINAMIDI